MFQMSLRGMKRRSNPDYNYCKLDCFAVLAMTKQYCVTKGFFALIARRRLKYPVPDFPELSRYNYYR